MNASSPPPTVQARSEPLAGPDRSGRGYALANVLSYVVNPLVLPPLGFGVILWHFGAPWGEIAWITGVSALFFFLLPLAYLLSMVRRGEAESLEVRRREDRARPFLVGIVFYAIGIAVIAATGRTALSLIVALALLYPINTLVMVLITLRWKISIHMVGVAGFVSILLFTSLLVSEALPPREGTALRVAVVAPLLLFVPLMMWARVRVGAHTVGQVLAGAVFGLVMPFVELAIVVRVLGLA